MSTTLPRTRDPASISAADLTFPLDPEVSFEGWTEEAFALLERLKAQPHIEQYRKEKEAGRLEPYLKKPFKRYRDDLVVNWVLPNRLGFETEKHVFSRLLKNDFGAGGCHHHRWMAFYRPSRRRLTDVQISHSLWPDGFHVGVYVGGYADDLLAQAKARVAAQPEAYLSRVNPVLERAERWRFYFYRGRGEHRRQEEYREPLADVPEALQGAEHIWLRRFFPREQVLALEGRLLRHVLEAIEALWPVYRFYLGPVRSDA